jgi:hypothetical protein
MNASEVTAFCSTLTTLQLMAHLKDLVPMVVKAGKSEFNFSIETMEVSSISEMEIVSSVNNREKFEQKAKTISNHRMTCQTSNEIKLTHAKKKDIPKIATFSKDGEFEFISDRQCKYQQHHTNTSSAWDANTDQTNRSSKDKWRREHPQARQSNQERVPATPKNDNDPTRSRSKQIIASIHPWIGTRKSFPKSVITKGINNNGMAKSASKIGPPPHNTTFDRRSNDEFKEKSVEIPVIYHNVRRKFNLENGADKYMEMSVYGADKSDVIPVIYHRLKRKLNLENV